MPNLHLYPFLFAASVVGILALATLRLRRASKRERRWKPDIRRVT
jgi:Flp pilus assembly protein protease CpaA